MISVSHPNGNNPSPMQLSRIDTNGRQRPDFRPSCATLWPVSWAKR
ncbi:hypothetical protein QNG98_gp29 [Yersinia phage PYps3T]|uniref:Uncharacterized protein n=1 Tax=Yersinia phage PYps3T TaxID=2801357 RepID=A0AAE7P3Q4_9CAUD|nr:hypothetical protein QNG98_gp29 [Yersinia phage PYps3T]QQO91031.1 hypothetical protein ORF029 [Yersinia phage PYps3T]QQO91117.1 hypothetical protein ORF030 [Yersinia phage PYps4T]QQO91286.1 hypothetical protein ORF029 [Yersinia phage PYps16T]